MEGIKNAYDQNQKAQDSGSGPACFQCPGFHQKKYPDLIQLRKCGRNILTFQRYAKRRDLLSVLLEDGKEYTMEQVDSLLQNFFKKGKVN